MLRYLTLALIAAFLAILSGCQPLKRVGYSYIPPETKADKLCASRCVSAKSSCEKICKMKNPNCFMQEEQNALYRFQLYQQEAMQKGERVTKKLKDFNYTYKCLSACNCTLSFNTCYMACGGQVIEHDK